MSNLEKKKNSIAVAKRYMETHVIAKLALEKNVSERKAMDLFYNSTTYKWFADDSYEVAREGPDAVFYRVLNELNGDLVI
jgi:hypothetical protein